MPSTLHIARVLAALWLLAITICLGDDARQTGKDAASNEKHSSGYKLTAKGISNFGEVTSTLYRGAQPTDEGFETLAKRGIDIVVDTRLSGRESEKKEVTKLGMRYVEIPWHCLFPKDAVFARFLKLIHDNPGKKVFVHCRLGDDRTGMMIAAYRMAEQGWTAEEALQEMQAFGFTTFHHMICSALGPYEKNFPEHVKKNPAFKELRSQDDTHQSK